jgi:hypothetical protein
LSQRGRHVAVLDHLAALRQLDQLLEHAHRGLHVLFLAGDAERSVAQGDAHGDVAFDLADVGVVVPQQGNGVEMLDRELANDHRSAFFQVAPKSAELSTGMAL